MLSACSSAIGPVIRGPLRSFDVLGAMASALYLRSGSDVIAVLTSEAVRLPCAVVVATPLSLVDLAPDGRVEGGSGRLQWTSGGRPVVVEVVREWQPPRVRPVVPRPDRLAELGARISMIDIGVSTGDPFAGIGRGPGLTPSGDDVLAGYLLGAQAFGLTVPALGELRTTALSAALLRYAAAGLCIPEPAAVIAGLGSAGSLELDPLLQVGHTSGAALAAGVLRASGQLRDEWSAVPDHSRYNRPLAGVGS